MAACYYRAFKLAKRILANFDPRR